MPLLSGNWKTRSLDKLGTPAAYSSADEEGHTQNVCGRNTRELTRLRSRDDKLHSGHRRLSERGSDSRARYVNCCHSTLLFQLLQNSLRSRPARLSLESSIEESPDSHVTGGGAGGVADRRQEKRSSFLPEVVRTVRTPPCESESHVSKSDSQATCTFITSLLPSLPPSLSPTCNNTAPFQWEHFGTTSQSWTYASRGNGCRGYRKRKAASAAVWVKTKTEVKGQSPDAKVTISDEC